MKPATIAYPGRPGAYSELAARRFLGDDARPRPWLTFAKTVRAVIEGRADYGVLPIHNTFAGIVRASTHLAANAPIAALDQLALPIRHALITVPGATFADLETVYSHPVALKQCRRFLHMHPGLTAIPHNDTGGAVEQVCRQQDITTAAIAGTHAAHLHGAQILARAIEDGADNQTLFLLFAPREKARYAIPYSSRPAEGQALGSRGNRRNQPFRKGANSCGAASSFTGR